jgi:hypothetical protein
MGLWGTKTKAYYREKIADKQAELARERAFKAAAPKSTATHRYSHDKDWHASIIARLQGEIAELRAKMANAPTK